MADAYKLIPQTGLTLGSTVTSNSITLAGLSGSTSLVASLINAGLAGSTNTRTARLFTATSNSAPYTITAPELDANSKVFKAFNALVDVNNTYYSDSVASQPNRLVEIVVDLTTPRLINKYRLYPGASSTTWGLIGWKIFGSNDNVTWFELDSRNNGSYLSLAYTGYYTFYSGAYRYIKFSSDNHGTNGLSLRDIELIEDTRTITGFDIVKNTFPVGLSTTVNNGDIVAMRIKCNSENDSVQHAILNFANFKQTAFTTVTVRAVVGPEHYANYEDKLPFEFTTTYTPSSPANRLFMVNAGNNGTTTLNFTDVPTPSPSTINDDKDYIFAADYFSDKLQRINPANGAIVHTITMTKPFSVHYTPTISPSSTEIAHTVIACPDIDTVYVYHGNSHSLLYSISTGANTKPVAVRGTETNTAGDFSIWVACFNSNTVQLYTKTGAAAPTLSKTYTMPANSGPSHCIVDSVTGDCYVSLLKTNQLARCNAANTTVTTANLTSDPWSLAINSSHIYVALPRENKIAAVSIGAMTTVTYMGSVADVGYMHLEGTTLWTLGFNSGDVNKYTMPTTTSLGTPTNISGGRRLGMGVAYSSADNLAYFLNMYNDSPLRYGVISKNPNAFDLIDVTDVNRNQPITSNAVVMSGLDVASPIQIPNIYSATLVINGIDRGTYYKINNGDSVAIKIISPNKSKTVVSIPVVFDTFYEIWEIETKTGISRVRIAGYLGGG